MSRSRSTARAAATPRPLERPLAMPPARRAWMACLLAGLCFLAYVSNLRPMAVWDSIPARLIPFTLLREGNVDFDEFRWLFRLYPRPYFLHEAQGGHWLSAYSVGVGILATPLYVPVVWWLQHQQIPDDDVRFRLATVVMERISAALIAAGSVALMWLALNRTTSPGMAAGMALVYGLGTSLWSVGSQTLLQHGGAALALAAMSCFLMAPDTPRNAVAAGAAATFAVLVRPTMVLFALVALVFVWRERRRHLLAFVSLPVAGTLALFAYNVQLGGLLRGGYHGLHFAVPRLKCLAGLLVSPSRGLFIYTPAALLALPVVWERRAHLLPWIRYLPAGIAAYLVLYSSWRGWWGGNTYGPRFLTDALPALVLCAVPTVERLWRSAAGRALVLILVAWGVAVQVVGVYCDDNTWNDRQKHNGIGRRVWNVDDSQILRAAQSGWHGTELAPLLWQTLTDPHPAPLTLLTGAQLTGEIVIQEPKPQPLRHGTRAAVRVQVTNRSEITWPAFSDYGYLQCKLTYRWWDHGSLRMESGAVPLPRNLGPNESADVSARVLTPAQPGDYELEMALVQVLGADKGASGGAVLRVPVQIE